VFFESQLDSDHCVSHFKEQKQPDSNEYRCKYTLDGAVDEEGLEKIQWNYEFKDQNRSDEYESPSGSKHNEKESD